MYKCISPWERKTHLHGFYLFNLYPITNWPFRLNPSPCPWPFPIDGYKKRVMFGFCLSLNTWWRCRCGRWSCGTSSGRSQSQCARLPPALLALARRGSAAGDEHGVRCVWEDIDREHVAKIRGQLTNLWRNSVARFIVTRAATATASTERSPCI